MKKRLAIVAAAAAAVSLLGFGTAQAGCDQGGPSAGHTDVLVAPGTGSHVYNDGGAPGGTSGFIGVHGGTGYIEAGGSATGPSGSIQGSTSGGEVDGKLSGDAGGVHLCLNDTVIL